MVVLTPPQLEWGWRGIPAIGFHMTETYHNHPLFHIVLLEDLQLCFELTSFEFFYGLIFLIYVSKAPVRSGQELTLSICSVIIRSHSTLLRALMRSHCALVSDMIPAW